MKISKIFSVMLFIIIGAKSINAQINIGSSKDAKQGAVLDLSQVEKKNLGLLLPQVDLYNVDDNWAIEGEVPPLGLMVYNSGKKGLAAGVYVWDGEKWRTTLSPSAAKQTPTITFNPITKTTDEASAPGALKWHLLSATYEPGTGPEPTFSLVSSVPQGSKVEFNKSNNKSYFYFGPQVKTAIIKVTYETTSTHLAATAFTTLTVTESLSPTVTINNVSVALESGANPINVGGTLKLKATVSSEPAGADQSVFWSASGGAAHVDQNGLVTGVSGGSVTVTATSKVDPAISSSPYSVTVNVPISGKGTDSEYMMNMGTGGPYRVYSVPGDLGIWTENIREQPCAAKSFGTTGDESYGWYYTYSQAEEACSKLGNGFRLPTKAEWDALVKYDGTEPRKGYAGLLRYVEGMKTRSFFLNDQSARGYYNANWMAGANNTTINRQVANWVGTPAVGEAVIMRYIINANSTYAIIYETHTAAWFNVRCIKK